MYRFFVIFMIVFMNIFEDWHAKMVFLARGYRRRYGHGKSWNRAYKHYKTNWTVVQRLLWIPLFKENYEQKYRDIAIFSYIQSALTPIMIGVFLISDYCFPSSKFWVYAFIVYTVLWLLRFIYNNHIAREK